MRDFLTATQAAALLGIKPATLYAYVARGLLAPTKIGKKSQYARADVMRLKARSDSRSGHIAAAASALQHGAPILDTSITAIDPTRGPIYRGKAAVDLIKKSPEYVARLLWNVPLSDAPFPRPKLELDRRILPFVEGRKPIDAIETGLFLLQRHTPRFVGSSETEVALAETVMQWCTASLTLADDARRFEDVLRRPIALGAATALGAPRAMEAIRAVLVLIADHELNSSAFAARVAASTGADLISCIHAALATLSGPRHGGMCDRIDALFDEIRDPKRAHDIIHARLRRGEAVPGFQADLYPKGDPRSPPLLELCRDDRVVTEVIDAMGEIKAKPSVDFAICAVAHSFKLTPGSATALFAIGRLSGWIAHVFEQRRSGLTLRPRARYVA
jgi:citrate synthase